ncbi:beta-ketoacyl synthase N-terminal-like domain-containing protein [Actinomadura meridiana]|uniref:Beta-ketoacyl synthase N-terminal-like domain-containing protein n=1 Tax=Actinomadura meridiana TaxID=559626 RepID=A0ABP8BX59_9ACTN
MNAPVIAGPVITAWETYSPLGHGARAHTGGLDAVHGTGETRSAVEGFDAREILGRRGTRSMDRVAGLAVATTARLLGRTGEPGAPLGGHAPEDVGLVLGMNDAISSVSAFVRDSWTRDKPYDVDPSHVPRTLMNFAAGQCAIRFGVKGPNTTICGSHATGLMTLNYARRLRRNGHAKVVVWGAVEELTAERVAVEAARPREEDARPPGEGCVMFLLESPDATTRKPLAEVLGVEFGVWADEGGVRDALSACLRRVLSRASVDPGAVSAVVPSPSTGHRGSQERQAIADVFGAAPVATRTAERVGDTGAASAAFQIVELLVQDGGSGRIGAVTTTDAEGRVGCALLRVL